jgi:hypothetical protein
LGRLPKQKTGRANQVARPVSEPERFFRNPYDVPDCEIASSVPEKNQLSEASSGIGPFA